MTHFEPTFGFTIDSRINFTMDSIALIIPVGTPLPFRRNLRIGIMTTTETNTATITIKCTDCFPAKWEVAASSNRSRRSRTRCNDD